MAICCFLKLAANFNLRVKRSLFPFAGDPTSPLLPSFRIALSNIKLSAAEFAQLFTSPLKCVLKSWAKFLEYFKRFSLRHILEFVIVNTRF